MCGICGIFRSQGLSEHDSRAVADSLERMHLRGPDGHGTHCDGNVILGHKRLAILDPKQGAQPWVDAKSGVSLSYNGEIYNFPKLKLELEAKGHRFHTNCDTEVLMRGYLEWGAEVIERLNGMFGFALFDPRTKQLWLARDRLGVKPLFYYQRGSLFAFASSISGLLVHPEIKPKLDPAALGHYFLTIRTTMGNRTLIEGIQSLQPGEMLFLDTQTGKTERRQYWRLPIVGSNEKQQLNLDQGAIEELRSRFDKAVKMQLITDVPLGGFLSGGLDSSVLAGSVLADNSSDFHAYSIGYQREGYNEWEFVRDTAEFHDINCRYIQLDEEDYLSDWRDLVEFKGCPLSTPNEVPISRLSRAFRNEFTVAMTGEGADEVFGGYGVPTFCAFDYDRSMGESGGIHPEALMRAYGKTALGSRREHFLTVNSWINPATQATVFPELFAKPDSPLETVLSWYDSVFADLDACSTFDAYLHVHAKVNLEGLLNRLDSSTMSASVEGRVPFTDHTIAEWLFTLPDDLKMSIQAGTDPAQVQQMNIYDLHAHGLVDTKRLLRSAFSDRVADSVLSRPKVSFPVPFREWFNSSLKAEYQQTLAESQLLSAICSPSLLHGEMTTSGEVNGMLAWPLMNLVLMEACWGIYI